MDFFRIRCDAPQCPNPRSQSRSPTTVRCILRTRLINCPQLFPLFRFRASLHCNNTNSNTNSHPLQRWVFGKLFSFIVNDLRGSYRLKPRKSLFTPFALLKYFERLWLQASCCNHGNFICALSKFRQGKSCHKVISLAAAVPRAAFSLKEDFIKLQCLLVACCCQVFFFSSPLILFLTPFAVEIGVQAI